MWNVYTPAQAFWFATIFSTESNEKCIQTEVNKKQRAKWDLLLPIVNVIRAVAFRDLKKPLLNVPAQLLGRTLCYAWFK